MIAQPATLARSPSFGRIAPVGLQPFGAQDAEYYWDLIPGHRDLEGIPETVRFWKTRIEERDAGRTYSVGVLFGPSGGGKTSFVRAGLLPVLSAAVIPVYVDAEADDAEAHLLASVRRMLPELPSACGLGEALAAVRQGRYLQGDQKLLMVLDHCERWLRSQTADHTTTLGEWLRECEGGRLQCLLVVRDDAWVTVSRLLHDLDIPLSTSGNAALLDGLDPLCARQTLAALGRGYGALPSGERALTSDQCAFLDEAIDGLSENGLVRPRRLAWFAHVMRRRCWSLSSLPRSLGDQELTTEYLQAAFADDAPPPAPLHRRAVHRVLDLLLPEFGSDVCPASSVAELRFASGYADSQRDFDELICLLEQDLQLIAPTNASDESGSDATADAGRCYRLSQAFLVPAIRSWLTRARLDTRRGRAETLLAERSKWWSVRPSRQELPNFGQWLAIRALTDKRQWTPPQRRMMVHAGRRQGVRAAMVVASLLVILLMAIRVRAWRNESVANALVARLLTAETSSVPSLIEELEAHQSTVGPRLLQAYQNSSDDSLTKLHAGLALADGSEAPFDFLSERLMCVEPSQFGAVRECLANRKSRIAERCWASVRDPSVSAADRFRAACALASYDAENAHWNDEKFAHFVAAQLVNVSPSDLVPWREALEPVRERLVPSLSAIYRDQRRSQTERLFAADVLAHFQKQEPGRLFELLADAEERQFKPLFAQLRGHRARAVELATSEIASSLAEDAGEVEKEALARRQANAAIALIRLGDVAPVRSLLKHSPDPRVASYIIHWLAPREGDARVVLEWYERESDVEIQRALLLCLGEFTAAQLPMALRGRIVDELLAAYRTAPDAGKRAAAAWLLRRWGQADQLVAIDQELRVSEEQLRLDAPLQRQWYVNAQGQSFVILNGEQPRASGMKRFAIMTTEVTKGQFLRFAPSFSHTESRRYPEPNCPIGGIMWYEAAAYCNWLSEQEGIPSNDWCFEPDDQGEFGSGLKVKPNFLELSGYRLPTEQEWEFACRAGTTSGRYYGLSEELLPRYAWYKENSEQVTWPVGYLKPNAFGLFDMHGGLFEWCHDRVSAAGDPAEGPGRAVADAAPVVDTDARVLRGGSFNSHALLVFSAHTSSGRPHVRSADLGFRVARTLP